MTCTKNQNTTRKKAIFFMKKSHFSWKSHIFYETTRSYLSCINEFLTDLSSSENSATSSCVYKPKEHPISFKKRLFRNPKTARRARHPKHHPNSLPNTPTTTFSNYETGNTPNPSCPPRQFPPFVLSSLATFECNAWRRRNAWRRDRSKKQNSKIHRFRRVMIETSLLYFPLINRFKKSRI